MPLWDFAWVADPSAWAGLGTLILLEIVLGIDNLVFISILASTLPKSERRHAFLVGLGLALLTRLVLLRSWPGSSALRSLWCTSSATVSPGGISS